MIQCCVYTVSMQLVIKPDTLLHERAQMRPWQKCTLDKRNQASPATMPFHQTAWNFTLERDIVDFTACSPAVWSLTLHAFNTRNTSSHPTSFFGFLVFSGQLPVFFLSHLFEWVILCFSQWCCCSIGKGRLWILHSCGWHYYEGSVGWCWCRRRRLEKRDQSEQTLKDETHRRCCHSSMSGLSWE